MKIRIGRFFALIVFTLPFIFPRSVLAFRFVSWADTKKGTATLRSLSVQVSPLNPVFTIYPGDVCDGGPNGTCFPIWKNALNGGSSPGNGTFDKTFASRGNHDSTGTAYWVSHFDVAGVAGRIGASNLSQLNTNLTYSFDYGNSHFIGADLPGGGVSNISSSIISWIDQDLTAAEGRPGIIHAFIFFHGPIYYVDDHPNSAPSSLITVLNKHSIVSATFHGHEHVQAYVHLSSSRIAAITHPFEEFVTGSAGAELYACASGRSNYCASQPGFASIDVNGASFTVNLYQLGNANPVKSYTFTKNVATTPTPTPTATPTSTPTPTATPTGKPTATPRGTVTPTPTGSPGVKIGDVNGDGKVNIDDIGIVVDYYGTDVSLMPKADVNGDGVINIIDIGIIVDHYE